MARNPKRGAAALTRASVYFGDRRRAHCAVCFLSSATSRAVICEPLAFGNVYSGAMTLGAGDNDLRDIGRSGFVDGPGARERGEWRDGAFAGPALTAYAGTFEYHLAARSHIRQHFAVGD